MEKERTRQVASSWEAISAFCCLAGGIMAGIVGTIVSALAWIIGGELHPWVRGLGSGLLIVTIPLLILAGYCLDWMEGKKKEPTRGFSRR